MRLPPGFLDANLETIEGLPQVRWSSVTDWIQRNAADNPDDAWHELVPAWLARLSTALGPGYRVLQCGEFLVLCGSRVADAESLAAFSDSSFKRIASMFPAVPEPPIHGPRIILVFDGHEPYYSYLAAYYPDGEFPSSSGCQLREWYRHIAVNGSGRQTRETILHELVHLRLTDFSPPVWLEEGLAEYLPQFMLDRHTFTLDREMVRRHKAYWSATSLEPFWAGESFDTIDDGRELSYHLAELLVRNLIADHPRSMRTFVQQASWEDAGAAAAQSCFGRTLGQIAAQFLGEGQWEPNPEAPEGQSE